MKLIYTNNFNKLFEQLNVTLEIEELQALINYKVQLALDYDIFQYNEHPSKIQVDLSEFFSLDGWHSYKSDNLYSWLTKEEVKMLEPKIRNIKSVERELTWYTTSVSYEMKYYDMLPNIKILPEISKEDRNIPFHARPTQLKYRKNQVDKRLLNRLKRKKK